MIVERVLFPVDCSAEVAAPEGSGSAVADTGTVWSEAIFTGIDAAVSAEPWLGTFASRLVVSPAMVERELFPVV